MKFLPFVFIRSGGKNFAFSFPAAASWEAEATGGGIQIILPPKYLLIVAASGFRLPNDVGLQNTLPPKKVLAATANWVAKATESGPSNHLASKISTDGCFQNTLPPKKNAGGGRQLGG